MSIVEQYSVDHVSLSKLPTPDVLAPLRCRARLTTLGTRLVTGSPRLTSTLALRDRPLAGLLRVLTCHSVSGAGRVGRATGSVLVTCTTSAALSRLTTNINVAHLLIGTNGPSSMPPVPSIVRSSATLHHHIRLRPRHTSTKSIL